MKMLGRSNTIVILTAGLIGVPMVSISGRADEKRPPTVETVWLRDLNVSHVIPPGARPRDQVTLKPRSVPGYDQLRSAL
jgi:hypothetical protein